jgi:23S rRNA (adenine-N6)-dimethyltransferase
VRGRDAPAARPPLGQHFLRSRALASAIVDDAGVAPGELALDLGAGHGVLAAELERRGARVLALELVPRLVQELESRFAASDRVAVRCADLRRLVPPREPFRVVANLPFDGATAVLRRLLDDPGIPLLTADVVLQWEVAAKRAALWPTTQLSAFWSAWHELELVRRLPRSAFAPPPRVDAGVLRVTRRGEPFIPLREARAYRTFLAACFAERPRALVPGRTLKRLAAELGFDANGAARDLDARQLAALFHAVRRTG